MTRSAKSLKRPGSRDWLWLLPLETRVPKSKPLLLQGFLLRSSPLELATQSEPPNVEISEIATFSSRGPTPDGWMKPDLVAPGSEIISLRSKGSSSIYSCFTTEWAPIIFRYQEHPWQHPSSLESLLYCSLKSPSSLPMR